LVKIDSIIPDPESDRALISYEIDFEVVQPAKTVAGKARYIALVTALNGSPKIEKIEEIITHRRKLLTLEE
jgi:hypothetical protein